MSLHLGNLSPRIRREDLERVFRRFGRNTIQIKDKYGFVVYDHPVNAEKALRALKGKIICGERISLTWSNKQPKPFQRFNKGSRFYEPYHRRNLIRREDHATREETTSHHERGFKRVSDDEGRGPKLGGFLNKEKDYPCDDVVDGGGEKGENVKEVLIGEGLPVETNVGDSGRWGEPVSSTLDTKEAENVASLDLYEPYHGYARDEDYKATSYSSPARGSSRETSQVDRVVNTTVKGAVDSKYQLKCYVCGLVGHIKRNCPQGNAPQQERFTRFDPRRDNDISFRVRDGRGLKRVTSPSWRRSKSRKSPPPSRRKRDGTILDSRKHPRLTNNETFPSCKVRDFQRKKKHKREDRDSVKIPRKSERDGSLTQHSESTSSSSRSRSASSGIKSHSRSRSRSTPESFRKHSVSSTSRPMPSSSKSRSRSRSKSRSASPSSLSLSVSLSPPFLSSNGKGDIKETAIPPKNHLDKDNRSESMHTLIDQRQMEGDDPNIDNPKRKSENGTLLDENRLSSIDLGDEMITNHNTQLKDDRDHVLDRTGCNVNGPNSPSEKYVVAADNLSSESSGEMRDLRISLSPETKNTVSFEKQNVDVPSTSESKKSTSISSQEMCVVLKHYGLPTPNESEENLSVEAFFGCARLWPWELIYYRRLKKGPISTENYARRIAQNEEFGIVDNYVRSSSGWGERDQSSC